VFERLLVLCADPSAAAASVALVLNQRLIRRLCRECSGKGCPHCLSTGYRGRLPLVEWLRVNDAARHRIAARDLDALTTHPPLADAAKALVKAGLTNDSEVDRVLGFRS
jgi:type II secretory ATPase GspE/PulE/Tfp pilus assembly ATPase PilB-like protein